MIKTILFAFALSPLLVSAAPASPVTQGFQLVSPYGILKVKTALQWTGAQRVALWVVAQSLNLVYAALAVVCLLLWFLVVELSEE
jgi:hypothetical protein